MALNTTDKSLDNRYAGLEIYIECRNKPAETERKSGGMGGKYCSVAYCKPTVVKPAVLLVFHSNEAEFVINAIVMGAISIRYNIVINVSLCHNFPGL